MRNAIGVDLDNQISLEQKNEKLRQLVTVYINAGGRGTRMEGIKGIKKTEVGITKALVNFNGKPMVQHHVDIVRALGLRNVVVGGGDHRNIKKYFDRQVLDSNDIKVVNTIEQKDTGGDLIKAVRENKNYFGRYVLVENVDTLLYVDTLSELIKQHNSTKAKATIVLTTKKGVPNENAFFVDKNNRIVFSREAADKYKLKEPDNFVGHQGSSTGMIIFDKDLLLKYNWQPGDGRLSIYRDIIPELIKKGELMAYNTGKVFFVDTGTVKTYDRVKRHEKKVFRALHDKYLKQ